MAIGPIIFFDKYKNMALDELKRKRRELVSPSSRIALFKSLFLERKYKIDDNSCIGNDRTEREVIRTLIQFKTRFPHYDVCQLTYWEIQNMLKNRRSVK